MKKILITGASSYIGASLEQYLSQWPEAYQADKISLRDDRWREAALEGYDAVVHAAGIAHRKETADNAAEYYKINRDLAAAFARRAKEAGCPSLFF